jgi:hypothetical protein
MAQFLVEGVFETGGRGYVIARLLDSETTFEVPSEARLGGVAVERWLDIPRALDARGNQRRDVFGFCLKDIGDRDRLKIGVRAELTGDVSVA